MSILATDVRRSVGEMADSHLRDGFLNRKEPHSRENPLIRRRRFVQLISKFVFDRFFISAVFRDFLAATNSMKWGYPGHVLRIDPGSWKCVQLSSPIMFWKTVY